MARTAPASFIFNVLVHKVEIGRVTGVSYAQAENRARALAAAAGHKRFEMMLANGAGMGARPVDSVDCNRRLGRARYATPGFEARRAELIAAHKAGQ